MYEVTSGKKGGRIEEATPRHPEGRNYQGQHERHPGSNVNEAKGNPGHQPVLNMNVSRKAPAKTGGHKVESAGHAHGTGGAGNMHMKGAPKKHIDRNNAGGG